jgi:hypothetical protein
MGQIDKKTLRSTSKLLTAVTIVLAYFTSSCRVFPWSGIPSRPILTALTQTTRFELRQSRKLLAPIATSITAVSVDAINNETIALFDTGEIYRWNKQGIARDVNIVNSFNEKDKAEFSDDGKTIWVVRSDTDTVTKSRIWQNSQIIKYSTINMQSSSRKFSGEVGTFTSSPDNKKLAIIGNASWGLYNVDKTFKEIANKLYHLGPGEQAYLGFDSVTFDRDAEYIALADRNGWVQFEDIKNRVSIGIIEVLPQPGSKQEVVWKPHRMKFSASQKTLAIIADQINKDSESTVLFVIDLTNRRLIVKKTLGLNNVRFISLATSPTSDIFVAYSHEGVFVLNALNGQTLTTIELFSPPTAITFSQDGKKLIVGTLKGDIYEYDVNLTE